MSKIELVVMDWAGTAVDFGSMAPILALDHAFRASGLEIPHDLLRLSMGLAKKDHIREILALPQVAEQWETKFAAAPAERDVEALYVEFTPRMTEEIAASAILIPGVADFAAALRRRGIKLAGTTGYTRDMLDRLIAGAAPQGYQPELSLCPDDVGGGRPHPWMCCRIAVELRITALAHAVKIGDTPSDIAEGRNAGMWTIGVTTSGNQVGLSLADWDALSLDSQDEARRKAESDLMQAGAHFVADSAPVALPLLDEIESRLARGERP